LAEVPTYGSIPQTPQSLTIEGKEDCIKMLSNGIKERPKNVIS